MGIDVVVSGSRKIGEAMADLGDFQLVMVDGRLVSPDEAPPLRWNEVRLRSAAGIITVQRRGEGIAVVVFGNATPELNAAQQRIAKAFSP